MDLSKTNTAPIPVEDDLTEARKPASLLVAQFFFFPLIIIGICVGIFLLFGYLIHEERTPESFLKDIQSHPGDGYFEKAWRGQAAYGLSNLIAANGEKIRKSDFPAKVLEVYKNSRPASVPDANRDKAAPASIREFLALTLGQLGDPNAVPALVEGLGDAEVGSRINAAWALGSIGEETALPEIMKLLHDEEGAVRRTAAYVVGAFAERKPVNGEAAVQARHDLEVLLNDPREDVRWNAAIALAQMNDPAGADLLMKLLDSEYVEKIENVKADDKEALRVSAVKLLARLNYAPAHAKIVLLSQNDPSVRVQRASIEALKSGKKN